MTTTVSYPFYCKKVFSQCRILFLNFSILACGDKVSRFLFWFIVVLLHLSRQTKRYSVHSGSRSSLLRAFKDPAISADFKVSFTSSRIPTEHSGHDHDGTFFFVNGIVHIFLLIGILLIPLTKSFYYWSSTESKNKTPCLYSAWWYSRFCRRAIRPGVSRGSSRDRRRRRAGRRRPSGESL